MNLLTIGNVGGKHKSALITLVGGVGSGTVVATGTPEEVADNPASFTGQHLKMKLRYAFKKESLALFF